MKRLTIISLLAGLFCGAVSCQTEYEALLSSNNMDDKYEAAFKYFNEGKFQRSSQLFESLTLHSASTERDDTINYYLGLSNYRYKDYYTAQTNFENFVIKYPNSAFAEAATFYKIDCMYRGTLRYELDQTPTYSTITEINKFLIEYPSTEWRGVCDKMLTDLGERLDRKAYENALLYYKMEDYKASRVAFRNVLKDDADNIYREDILYYTAMSSYKYADLSIKEKQHERYLQFFDDYFNFVGEYPESKYRAELDRLYRKSKEK